MDTERLRQISREADVNINKERARAQAESLQKRKEFIENQQSKVETRMEAAAKNGLGSAIVFAMCFRAHECGPEYTEYDADLHNKIVEYCKEKGLEAHEERVNLYGEGQVYSIRVVWDKESRRHDSFYPFEDGTYLGFGSILNEN